MGFRAAVVLAVFSAHNAFNCWMFLNFTSFKPAEELLSVSESQVGFITTAGWLGILLMLPVVTLCTWHRSLLFFAGVLNVGAPIMRYFAARGGNYPVVALTNFLQGASFGVIGAWPPMLAAMQWPQQRRALVIAVASLSNYLGGAAGVVFFASASASALLDAFRLQAIVAVALAVAMLSWLWLPPYQPPTACSTSADTAVSPALLDVSDTAGKYGREGESEAGSLASATSLRGLGGGGGAAGTAASALSLSQQLRICARRPQATHILVLGLVIGVSLLLQGMNQYMLAGLGFSDFDAGLGNSLYQLSAAIVGVGLSSVVTDERGATRVLRGLHAGMLAGMLLLLALGLTTRRFGAFDGAVPLMLAVMTLFGSTLMGMLPFCLQLLVHVCAPASENVVAGLVYILAMALAAALTQCCADAPPLVTLLLAEGLLLVELIAVRHTVVGDASSDTRCAVVDTGESATQICAQAEPRARLLAS